MKRLVDLWRMPGGNGLAIAAVAIPLMVWLPANRIMVALIALFLFPILDIPRVLARPSWWRGAIVSAIVWFFLFSGLIAIADAVRRLGEDQVAFVLPFTFYPIALGVSGLVRLEGRLRGRRRELDFRITAIACGSLVVLPILLGVIPAVVEKITGNTPANTVYSSDGEILSVDADHFSVRVAGKVESFRFGADTKFDFRGPGWKQVTDPPAGPVWLKAGQRVGMEYVYRRHEAQAQSVNIWVERKGCAGDAKWAAASQAPVAAASQSIASLAGTTWESWVGPRDQPGQREMMFEFLAENRLTYESASGRHTDGAWRQNGASVLVEVNDCYAVYEGQIDGDEIRGEFTNEMNARAPWTARRKQTAPTPTPSK